MSGGDGASSADVFLGRSGSQTLAVGTPAAATDLNILGAARVQVRNTPVLAAVPGRFAVNTTTVSSVGTIESELAAVTVPGNSLANPGDALQLRASGTFGPSAGPKTLTLYYGNAVVFSTGSQAFINSSWVLTGEILRTGPNSQLINTTFISDSSVLRSTAGVTIAAEDNAATNRVRFTAMGDVDGAVVQRSATIDWKPAN